MTYQQLHNLARANPVLDVPVLHPVTSHQLGRVRAGRFLPYFSESWYASSLAQCAITNYDGIISSRAAGNGEDTVFVKTTATGGVSGVWYSLLRSAGFPNAIAPSNIPGGTALNRTSQGAIPLQNPASGSKYLLTLGVSVPSITGFSAILLADVLVAAANISATSTAAQTVNTAALTRWATGDGVLMTLGVTTALGATASNVTISYTNSSGVAGRSTGAIAMTGSAAANRLQPGAGGFLIPLQNGDTGVRSIQTVTFSASMGAGVLDIYLFKPLVLIPTVGANTFIERDSTVQIDGLTELPVGSDSQVGCLGCFALTGGTATSTLTGFLRTCNG
ncbi:MAG: hypothetical protein FJW20_17645 [Acidimicrobiia bacterium]|nr:hypothetical protein [Acidimicrobiia bacterium]